MEMMTLAPQNGNQASGNSARKIVSIGNYRFTGKKLGRGNFARVDEAIHSVLNTKVAIKIMDTIAIKEEYVVRNLYREARIMAKLSHPCIVALFQTMQYGNLYYLVTELVGGGDLCGFIKNQRSGKLEERFTRVYARQLISAVAHMHNIGIVHRDLKMENIMLNSIHTQIKIVDFGLSNFYYDDNPLRTHCGSPEYAAPELFVEGKHYGPEVDLWSLGVILYGMVVGQLPFNTTRCSTMTSQQRRKKLLEQINKGLATTQRRALHGFSTEFKMMMAKLLVADSAKRIKIAELIFYPWVTEKGRKAVRSNPLKRLDEHAQSHLIQEVANQIQMDWTDVQHAIKYDPQCNIAGMYNILEFKLMMKYLQGDGITKTLTVESPKTLHSQRSTAPYSQTPTTPKEMFITIKNPTSIEYPNTRKSAPIQRLVKKKTLDSVNSPHSAGMHLRSKAMTAASGDSHKIPTIPKESPLLNTFLLSTMNPKKTRIQQNLLRRKELKSSPISISNKHIRNIPLSSRTLQSPRDQISRDVVMKSSSARKSSDGGTRRFVISNNKIADKKIALNKYSAESPSRIRDYHCKDLTIKRPQSPIEKKRYTDIPLKRKSLLPVLIPNMAPPLGLDICSSHYRQLHRHGSPTGPRSNPWRPPTRSSIISAPTKSLRKYSALNCDHLPIDDRCYNATGDAVKRFSSITGTAKATKGNFFNEPIARSIAGYVANNIPAKLQTFKWIKNSKTGRGS